METLIECHPIKSLKEVLEWKQPQCDYYIEKLKKRTGTKQCPKVLVCHDMQGGYLDDRHIQGVNSIDNYRFFHWANIDIFIYFSHYFVTIPPSTWITSAHRNGVRILGTIITEWDQGNEICQEILKTHKNQSLLACKLAAMARFYGLDGWLLNIENAIKDTNSLEDFVYLLTEANHAVNPDSLVIWYDSVITTGELKWQNELNLLNKCFFDACDGIFLNYNWNYDTLKNSASLANERKHDVYVGIDVFGRGCLGGGGFNTEVAVKAAKEHDLSLAIFAPGWVFETLEKENFLENQYKFWEIISNACPTYCLTELPFITSFCQGFGKKMYHKGKVISEKCWHNLSLQQIQPSFHWKQCVQDDCSFATIYTEDAYNSGGCLELWTVGNNKNTSQHFRLFQTHFLLNSSMLISYTFKEVVPHTRVALLLQIKHSENVFQLHLTDNHSHSDSNEKEDSHSKILKIDQKILFPLSNEEIEKYSERSEIDVTTESTEGWTTRVYLLDNKYFENGIVTDISVEISNSCSKANIPYFILLGQIQIVPIKNECCIKCHQLTKEVTEDEKFILISCLLKWDRLCSFSLTDCWDIFCFYNSEKLYIGSTNENFYYIHKFQIANKPQSMQYIQFSVSHRNNQNCNDKHDAFNHKMALFI